MALLSFAVLIQVTTILLISLPTFAVSTTFSGTLNKSLLYHGDLNAHLSPFLYQKLPPSPYQIEDYYPHNGERDEVLTSCYEYSEEFCHGANLEAIRVRFSELTDDTTESWILCRCDDHRLAPSLGNQKGSHAKLQWDYILSHFSRLPFPLRRYVRAVVTVPLVQLHSTDHAQSTFSLSSVPTSPKVLETPHGMMSGGVVVLFGEPTLGTWIHEAAHALSLSHLVFSSSQLWVDALKEDSCVTDAYSLKSSEEAFAQAVILKTYFLYEGSKRFQNQHFYDELIGNYSCIRNQLAALDCLPIFLNHTSDIDSTSWWELWFMTTLLLSLFLLAR